MSAEAEVIGKLRGRLAMSGLRKLDACAEANRFAFRKAWLGSMGVEHGVTLLSLIEELCSVLDICVVGRRVEVPTRDGVVAIANHVGIAKLMKVRRLQIECSLSADQRRSYPMTGRLLNSDSFLALFAAPIASLLSVFGDLRLDIIPVSVRYQGAFGEIAQSLGFIQISAREKRAFDFVVSEVSLRAMTAKASGALPVVIMFPEAGTSGKRQSGDPFVLEPFRSGFLRLAQQLDFSILPVVTTFNRRFEVFAQALAVAQATDGQTNDLIGQIRQVMQCQINRNLAAAAA